MKHYVISRNEEYRTTGPHGAKPQDAICTIDESLIGKAFKVIDSEPDEFDEVHKIAVLDVSAETQRLADIETKEAAEAATRSAFRAEVQAFRDLDPSTCTNMATTRAYLRDQKQAFAKILKALLDSNQE